VILPSASAKSSCRKASISQLKLLPISSIYCAFDRFSVCEIMRSSRSLACAARSHALALSALP